MSGKYLKTIIFFLLISTQSVCAQQKFDIAWLKNPQKYMSELEACFSYSEIETYKPKESIYIIFLQNGYAEANFQNSKAWIPDVINRNVKEVTIIFSKYPYFKEDWITNYYSLLAKRLISLFELDPKLNSKSIEWKLLVQTNCKTEKDALGLLHGMEIKSEYFSLDEMDNSKGNTDKPYPGNSSLHDSIIMKDMDRYKVPDGYWEFHYEQEKQLEKSKKYQPKKSKKKRRKAPKCPDFSKKKRFRIF
ncbi:MAG: hypothetical protein U9R19_02385 [Bacteroidota bacterium]|nr:hypothetical protein [Bacteroidota bacterium]